MSKDPTILYSTLLGEIGRFGPEHESRPMCDVKGCSRLAAPRDSYENGFKLFNAGKADKFWRTEKGSDGKAYNCCQECHDAWNEYNRELGSLYFEVWMQFTEDERGELLTIEKAYRHLGTSKSEIRELISSDVDFVAQSPNFVNPQLNVYTTERIM